VFLAGIAVSSGCRSLQQPKPVPVEPVADPNQVLADYAAQAIRAGGGIAPWKQIDKLDLDCVVTFYRADGSYYLTAHRHEIHPWKASIRMHGQEPQGQFLVEFSRQTHGAPKHTGSSYPVALCSEPYFGELVLDLVTAPVRLLDRGVKLSRSPAMVKKASEWYYLVNRVGSAGGLWSNAVFHQRADSQLIESVTFTEAGGGGLVARGYDYDRLSGGNVLIPRKVEIYRADAQGVLTRLLVEMDYNL